MTIKAVIFDFDGTMVDTESCAYEAWLEIYGEYGIDLPLSEWQKCVGASYSSFDPVDFLASQSGKSLDREALVARKNRRKATLADQQPLLPGTLERIHQAKECGLAMAVASSSAYDWVDHHLRRTHTRDYFSVLVTKGDVTKVKPDPQIFLIAAERLGVSAADCLVIEDSYNGVLAAKKAGMLCIAIPGPITRSLDFSQADACLPSMNSLDFGRY